MKIEKPIAGIRSLSMIDYPGHVSSVVFFAGCNFRCWFCHNKKIAFTETEKHFNMSYDEAFEELSRLRSKVGYVVITGGEPSIYGDDLIEFIKKLKNELNYKIKLDTNGYKPDIIEKAIPYLNFIAMDIKDTKKNYSKTSGINIDFSIIERSIILIRDSGLDYQFRTTVLPFMNYIELQSFYKSNYNIDIFQQKYIGEVYE